MIFPCFPALMCTSAPGALLVVGVVSAPDHTRQRQAARSSWMAHLAPVEMLACFSIRLPPSMLRAAPDGTQGRQGIPQGAAELRRESGAHGDLVLVGDANSSGLMTEGSYGWWAHAVARFPDARFVAKTDDDAVVNGPALASHLHRLSCMQDTHAYVGHLFYASFNPRTQAVCSWNRGWAPQEYRAFQCDENGAHPPVPCALGAFAMLSHRLARWIGTSGAVRRLMAHGIETQRRSLGRTVHPEDVLLGFCVSRAPYPVTYVRLSWLMVHDVKCAATDGAVFPARVPTPQLPSASTAVAAEPAAGVRERQRGFERVVPSLVVHNLKQPSSVEYVSRVLQGRTELQAQGCDQALRGERFPSGA